ncbi:MAG: hypothetical protein ACE5I8_02555, partial [Thermodesulfobacteriota bacterium]
MRHHIGEMSPGKEGAIGRCTPFPTFGGRPSSIYEPRSQFGPDLGRFSVGRGGRNASAQPPPRRRLTKLSVRGRMSAMKVGILTGGGDCPGLNCVIRAVAVVNLHKGAQTIGIRR